MSLAYVQLHTSNATTKRGSFVLFLHNCMWACFCLNHCGCVSQEKPARPPCGITTPGCISTTTPQRGSLPSSSRISSTPCSLMPASSSCSGTQWRGDTNLLFYWLLPLHIYTENARQQRCRRSSDTHTATTFVPPSQQFTLQIQTDTFHVYRKQQSYCHRGCVAFYSAGLSHAFHYDAFIRELTAECLRGFLFKLGLLYAVNIDFFTLENVWTWRSL